MQASGQRESARALAVGREGIELSRMSPTPVGQRGLGDSAAVAEAAAGGDGKREYVRDVFEQIAPSYDLLNHLLSFNVDRSWRRQAIEMLEWKRAPTGVYLDLCAGTMDVSAALASTEGFSGRVIAADFAEAMLRAGRGKAKPGAAWPLLADALWLPLADASVSGAIVAFGARNLANLDAGLREVRRVLRPHGRFVILEFTTPASPLVRSVYHAYFHHLLPFIGAMISGHRTAYAYLPQSVAAFPTPAELASRMRSAGFERVLSRSLTFGIAAIHVGEC